MSLHQGYDARQRGEDKDQSCIFAYYYSDLNAMGENEFCDDSPCWDDDDCVSNYCNSSTGTCTKDQAWIWWIIAGSILICLSLIILIKWCAKRGSQPTGEAATRNQSNTQTDQHSVNAQPAPQVHADYVELK